MTKNNLKVVKTDNKKEQELKEKSKSLEAAISQIDQNFGKGSVMRLGQQEALDVEAISNRITKFRLGPWYWWVTKRKNNRNLWTRVLRKNNSCTASCCRGTKSWRHMCICRCRTCYGSLFMQKIGVKTDELLISQPDTGEQALEITDTLN